MTDPFTERVAVVTGGAAGIGLAMARAFAQRGARLVLADRDEAALALAEKQLRSEGAEAIGVPTDVRERASLAALVERSLAHFGGAHIVCNNAGIAVFGPLAEASREEFQTCFDINFWGVVNGTEAFLPHLLEQGDGHIVNTASMSGLVGMVGMGIYCASKFAVVGYTESLHREVQPRGVGVSVLCPMIVRTQIFQNSRQLLGAPVEGDVQEPTGLGQVIGTEDVARRVVSAIESRQLYVLTHPEQRAILSRRSSKLDRAFDDWE